MNFKYFDSLLEPCFVINEKGQIIYTNSPGELVSKQSARKIIRQKEKLTDLFKISDPPGFLLQPTDIDEATPYIECSLLNSEGEELSAQISCQKVESPTTEPTWLLYFRDVTLEATLQKKYRKEFEQKEQTYKKLEEAHAQLADYSKNLEIMVQERTKDLAELNHKMRALVDSLSQGFLMIASNGVVQPGASRSCETLLGENPVGKPLTELLSFDEKKSESFRKWMITAFAEMLPFEDLAPLAPPRLEFKDRNMTVDLAYSAVRNENNEIESIVIVLTDVTPLLMAEKEARIEKKNAELVLNILKKKNQFKTFINDAKELVADLAQQRDSAGPQNSKDIFRLLHTLKGGAASFSIESLTQKCHQAETELSENNWLLLKQSILQIRILFDEFLNQFASLFFSLESGEIREIPLTRLNDLKQFLKLNVSPEIFAQASLFLFGQSLQETFESYSESLENLASTLGKEIRPLHFGEGANQLLPIEFLSPLFATFIHAFRNSIDHGIELPELRESLGKPRAGLISLSCHVTDSGFLQIEVKDDGQGISPLAIRKKCDRLGIDHSTESDHEVIQHVFDSAFSLKEEVTEISGRGVGMDAIQSEVIKLGGTVEVFSRYPHQGTLIRVCLPQNILLARRLRPTG